jgi:hypothetical protein
MKVRTGEIAGNYGKQNSKYLIRAVSQQVTSLTFRRSSATTEHRTRSVSIATSRPYLQERERVCVRERESVCVRERERESVCVTERERERGRERGGEGVCARESVCVRKKV